MKTARATAKVSEDYLELIRELPLRPLKSKADFARAGAILDRLVGRTDLSAGQRDYVAALARFVHEYERLSTRSRLQKLSPVELLKHLMTENRMSVSDLGRLLGSRGLASEVLSGKRGLSNAVIAKLAIRFKLDPALFWKLRNAA